MRIDEVTTRTYHFEEGDVVVNYMYNWAAIKVRTHDAEPTKWRHTNSDSPYDPVFTDETVEKSLELGTWFYLGNRVEIEKLKYLEDTD